MATTALISVSEYLTTSYRPDCDYVDGELVERNVGERDHSWLQGEILDALRPYRLSLGLFSLPEQRVQVKPKRYRVPDVTVTRGRLDEAIVRTPPFLCVEVLSQEDSMSSMQERIDDYVSFGVENIWILDPIRKKAFWADADGTYPSRDGVLHTKGGELTVDFGPLWFS
jgi:Uma2 family endonuclease